MIIPKREITLIVISKKPATINIPAKEIGILYKIKDISRADELKKQSLELKESAKILSDKLQQIQISIHNILLEIPNIPHSSVPYGEGEQDNEIIKASPSVIFPEPLIPHWEIASKTGIIDFESGSKITGAGFPVYKNQGAKLQRALISYFLDKASENGYQEIEPPLMVNENSAFGTGQLPDKDGQMYHATEDNFFLIPTAEVPLTNLYQNMILDLNDLPVKLCGYTPCFRREAGSYGKDVKGLNRLHQFDKVEIVHIEHPDRSYDTLNEMVAYVESLIISLGLPYRILKLCGKDLSFTSALTYDFEVWSAAQQRWLEVSSVSNFETFQSNRMKLRFKDSDNKNKLLHTLNGSALALPRILAAILENYQKNNTIEIPKVLLPYLSFERIEI